MPFTAIAEAVLRKENLAGLDFAPLSLLNPIKACYIRILQKLHVFNRQSDLLRKRRIVGREQ